MKELSTQSQSLGKKIVEINGIKLEIDFDKATRIMEFKIGDCVKVLKKKYSDQYEVFLGMIVGFECFEKLPTIQIAYIENEYSAVDIKFLNFNSAIKDVEICATTELELRLDKNNILQKFDNEVEKLQRQIKDIQYKKNIFLNTFAAKFKFIDESGAAQ